jgi:uncharacterized protein
MPPLHCIELAASEQQQLLGIARDAIHVGLRGEDYLHRPAHWPPALHAHRAVFVTLSRRARLRGCIGSIEPSGPLAEAVADSAHGAAFRDPRFAQLQREELPATRIEISVLSPMQPLAVSSREDLLSQLQPAIDGLLLRDGRHRSTFLPKVWEQLPDPETFLQQLLAKAGLPDNHWSPTLQFHRYQTHTFCEAESQEPA